MTEAGWTRNKPTVAGWYWWRYAGEPAVVRVIHSMYGLVIEGHVGLVQNMNAHWLGPITPTDRQQGRVAGLREAKENLERLEYRDTRLQTDVEDFYAWIDDQLAQAAQDEKGVGDVHG